MSYNVVYVGVFVRYKITHKKHRVAHLHACESKRKVTSVNSPILLRKRTTISFYAQFCSLTG